MRIAILISGTGSNMKALVQNLGSKAEVVLIGADQPQAAGIAWANAQGLATWVPDDKYVEAGLVKALQHADVDMVCLAGFMRLVSKNFLDQWPNKVLNIHPSLLPAYPGLNTHARALANGDEWHGCTVHRVDEGMDTGPILAQAKVEVLPYDTPESLAQRVLVQEHKLYPQVVNELIDQLA